MKFSTFIEMQVRCLNPSSDGIPALGRPQKQKHGILNFRLNPSSDGIPALGGQFVADTIGASLNPSSDGIPALGFNSIIHP